MMRLQTIVFCIFLVGCSNKPSLETEKFKLSQKDLEELFSIIEVSSNPSQNLHVLYEEYFNDSVFVLNINQHGVVFDDNIEPSFKYNENKVFLYSSAKDKPPFWVPDSKYWSILVKAGEGGNFYQSLGFLNGNLNMTEEDSLIVNSEDFM